MLKNKGAVAVKLEDGTFEIWRCDSDTDASTLQQFQSNYIPYADKAGEVMFVVTSPLSEKDRANAISVITACLTEMLENSESIQKLNLSTSEYNERVQEFMENTIADLQLITLDELQDKFNILNNVEVTHEQ